MSDRDPEPAYLEREDGRRLAFQEFGAPGGAPVVLLHGVPGSRLRGAVLAESARDRGVRLICPDRPGMGASQLQPGRSVLDFAADVAALCEYLGLAQVGLLGVSGGAPYVGASALALGERCCVAGIASGTAPFHAPGVTAEMAPALKAVAFMARRLPRMARRRVEGGMRATYLGDPQKAADAVVRSASLADQRYFDSHPELAAGLAREIREGLQQGPDGVVTEIALMASPWGYALGDVQVRTHLWHGDQDHSAPLPMARYLQEQLPNAILSVFEDEGRMVVHQHAQEILATFAQT